MHMLYFRVEKMSEINYEYGFAIHLFITTFVRSYYVKSFEMGPSPVVCEDEHWLVPRVIQKHEQGM